jgi:CHASE1-domain containing sensor protein
VDAVAITAIVVGGVVSLTATALTIWAENRRQRQRTADERLNELRDVLHRGGAALTSAPYAFDRRKVSRTPSESAETGPDFNRKVEEVEAMEARIAIRLGEEEPTAAIY